MAATATLQNAWNCRWSRPGHRITGLSEAVQPEGVWVCVREGGRRSVCDDECARCSRWEPLATAVAPVAVFPLSHALLGETPALAMTTRLTRMSVAVFACRAVFVLLAVLFAAIGFAVLTEPLAIPFTVALWLCAATSLGFAAFGRFTPRWFDSN